MFDRILSILISNNHNIAETSFENYIDKEFYLMQLQSNFIILKSPKHLASGSHTFQSASISLSPFLLLSLIEFQKIIVLPRLIAIKNPHPLYFISPEIWIIVEIKVTQGHGCILILSIGGYCQYLAIKREILFRNPIKHIHKEIHCFSKVHAILQPYLHLILVRHHNSTLPFLSIGVPRYNLIDNSIFQGLLRTHLEINVAVSCNTLQRLTRTLVYK